MLRSFFILLIFVTSLTPITSALPDTSLSNRDLAQAQALIGHNQLHLGRLSDAQANCDSSLKLDPGNDLAKDCLNLVAELVIDQDLNKADALLINGDKSGAIALASAWARGGARRPDQQTRAWAILGKARSRGVPEVFVVFFPSWLKQVLIAISVLLFLVLCLIVIRKFWREWQSGKWYGNTTWTMLPLKEVSVAANLQTGIPTDSVLDAFARLGDELERKQWEPKLLLLRPTPPANYEPAIISEFLSDSLTPLVLVPGAKDLRLEWQLHEVQLDQAVQNLQLKTAAGIDIGSVARLIKNIFEWLNAGAPTISGVADVTEQNISIHLAARGGRIEFVAVTTSTQRAPGIDAIQLSAERAALKFLLRMRYPFMTNDEIDGFSALRQGACQFAQFAGTVPGVGDDANTRTSTLANAAFNLGFFRASIPPHCAPHPPSSECTSLALTEELRQAVLLAEGIAHSLVGTKQHLTRAIDCFRQLQDWPGLLQTDVLRQQATYNEAIIWRQLGHVKRCVLMLTELLGERAPDTIAKGSDDSRFAEPQVSLIPTINFPVRLARLAAFAKYDRDDWSTLPKSRAKLLIDDAENLVEQLDCYRQKNDLSAHDQRLAKYMYIETLRAIGHVELLRVITDAAAALYENKRPTRLKDKSMSEEGRNQLQHAIDWMLKCEQLAPSYDLFCDLAEAYLLLKDFTTAAGYARHATLEGNPDYERAYYLATESFFLQSTDNSIALANKYAKDFKGTVQLDEFRSVRADIGLREAVGGAAASPSPP